MNPIIRRTDNSFFYVKVVDFTKELWNDINVLRSPSFLGTESVSLLRVSKDVNK